MKKLIPVLAILAVCQSCKQPSSSATDKPLTVENSKPVDTRQKYPITIYRDKLNEAGTGYKPDNIVDSIPAENDTVAYLSALKKFYNQKITERTNYNYGQPKSFVVLDKNGVDLKAKLSDKLVSGLKNQVESTPEVQKMIEEYRKDSL